ncbi:MAG: hypothetical protein HC890_10845 [Chloroflexaceae bacterium]|nr:hypothetical protein [Chloroflexaceae bacterium]
MYTQFYLLVDGWLVPTSFLRIKQEPIAAFYPVIDTKTGISGEEWQAIQTFFTSQANENDIEKL